MARMLFKRTSVKGDGMHKSISNSPYADETVTDAMKLMAKVVEGENRMSIPDTSIRPGSMTRGKSTVVG